MCREQGILPPAVEPLDINILPDDVLLPVGRVSALVGPTIVVQVIPSPSHLPPFWHFSTLSAERILLYIPPRHLLPEQTAELLLRG